MKIIVQSSECVPDETRQNIIHFLNDYGYEIIVKKDDDIFDYIKKLDGNQVISGIVFFDYSEIAKKVVQTIRRNTHTNPWVPIAVFSKELEDTQYPLGINTFLLNGNVEDLPAFFSEPVDIKLLIIEDDESIADVLSQIFNSIYSVTVINDGLNGCDAILNKDFDAAIVDIQLPGMSGIDIIKKSREEGKSTPILAVTAHDSLNVELDILSASEGGDIQYLKKPFPTNQPELERLVQHFIFDSNFLKVERQNSIDLEWDEYWQKKKETTLL